MQEKDKNAFTVKFLCSFGNKIFDPEIIPIQDDQTDQRAPVNDPEALYEQFVIPEDMMEELESESLDDFDNDIYDYEDRTDLGVDIAAAAELSFKKSVENMKKKKKAHAEDKEKVIPDQDDTSVAE